MEITNQETETPVEAGGEEENKTEETPEVEPEAETEGEQKMGQQAKIGSRRNEILIIAF